MIINKYYSMYVAEGKRGIHDVRNDIKMLHDVKNNDSIDSLSRYIDKLYEMYNVRPFDPDSYFPNKVSLNSAISAIIDNAQTAILLMEKNLGPEYYITNLTTILAICDNIKSMPWLKNGGDEDAGVDVPKEDEKGD